MYARENPTKCELKGVLLMSKMILECQSSNSGILSYIIFFKIEQEKAFLEPSELLEAIFKTMVLSYHLMKCE